MTANMAHAALNALKALAGTPVPLKVSFHITYECNLGCAYCGRAQPAGEGLTTPEIIAMMKAFAAAGCISWTFNGGEPLLRPDLPRLVTEARRLDLTTSVVTNGTLLAAPGDLSWTRDLDTLLLSLDGPRHLCDRTRGKGTFDRVMEGIGNLPPDGPRLVLVAVLSRENVGQVDEIVEVGEGVRAQLLVQPVGDHDHLASPQAVSMMPSPEEIGSAVDALLEMKDQGRPVLSSRPYLQLLKDKWPRIPSGVPCLAGRVFCNITPGGRVAPCCARLGETITPSGPPGMATVDAFRSLPDSRDCGACYLYGPVEVSLLCGLRPGAVVDLGKAVIDGLRWAP